MALRNSRFLPNLLDKRNDSSTKHDNINMLADIPSCTGPGVGLARGERCGSATVATSSAGGLTIAPGFNTTAPTIEGFVATGTTEESGGNVGPASMGVVLLGGGTVTGIPVLSVASCLRGFG